MKIFLGFQVFKHALWQKTKTSNAGNQQKAFKIKKTSIVNGLRLLENCYRQSLCYLSTILASVTKNATFKLHGHKFEQHCEICVLNAQNTQKSAQNQINSLNTSKNKRIKVFCFFRVSNMLCGKKQKPGNARNQQNTFYFKDTHC